jgi:hypothetical protein
MLVPCLIAMFVLVIPCFAAYLYEKHIVKQGHCGLPWYRFDTDSQGGTGLHCQKCRETTWVSWYTKGVLDRKWL